MHCTVRLTLLCLWLPVAVGQREWSPWQSPWWNFENSVVARTYYGDVKGYSIPFHVEDEYSSPEWDERPRWYTRRVNVFLGIPYAEPPVGKLRFSYPRRPRWRLPDNAQGQSWDATYFRPACPQRIEEIWKDIPSFPKRNISEDCLYMNIFAPNITWHSLGSLYPVQVFIHGGEWMSGASQQYPAQVLATREIVVVTFNYRLGALGFLSTEDEHSPGNYGLLDQELALEFVKTNIRAFHGDPDRITLVGEGAGAASVGLHMLSPRTNTDRKDYFQQAIMMSGSDLSKFGYIDPFWRPREYAAEFGNILGCPGDDTYRMMQCLRDNSTFPWQILIEAQERIQPNDGPLGWVWGPVQDGGFYSTDPSFVPFLPETPPDLRNQYVRKVPTIIGLNINDGVKRANESIPRLGVGLFRNNFENFMMGVLQDWRIIDVYRERVYDAIEFQYTDWPDPENKSARAQEFINLVTDYEFGVGIDTVAKQNQQQENTYFYSFEYKSWNDYLPHWMGVGMSAILPYYLGVPFMNETVLNETEIVPRQFYDHEDRNMSDWVMSLWCNFSHFGNPTPNITNNITWDIFNDYNLSYLIIDEHAHMWFQYRQNKYAFWKDFIPKYAVQDYYIPTATPTPQGQDWKWGLGGATVIFIILLIIVAICIYLLVLQSRKEAENEAYAESQLPLSFSRSQSEMTVLSGDNSRSTAGTGRYPYPGSYEYGGRDYSQDYANRSYGGYESSGAQPSQPYGSQYKQRAYGYGYDKDVSYSDSYVSQGQYNQSDV